MQIACDKKQSQAEPIIILQETLDPKVKVLPHFSPLSFCHT